MPSDAVLQDVVRALAAPIEHYRSAVATTLEEVRGYLASHHSGAEGRSAQLGLELGVFADGRIDVARLAGVLGEEPTLDPTAMAELQHAFQVLTTLAGSDERLFQVSVPAGGDLTATVAARLAEAGRLFAAARLAAHALRGPHVPESGTPAMADGFAFPRWTAAERRLAPPVVACVQGGDLRTSGLADFLDGGQKIVLVVEGDCAPAPLARLITPSTLVVQTDRVEELSRLSAWPGPAVAAVVPATAARFVHDPAGGAETWQRLTVQYLPDPPRRAVGGLSPAQQAEDLRQLAALAAPPSGTVTALPATAPVAAGDPVDHLAAWLLQQANLPAPR